MCGICGVFALQAPLASVLGQSITSMATALSHRGPDGAGFFTDDRVALGHRRLAIIDRDGGKQPLSNEDGTCWIVFNGEIYNHSDLRQQLTARGHTFRTRSDTEAIVHAYEEYGPDCVHHLEGMFAFAIYDQRRQEVFLARDRLGKKPLFYAVFDGHLHFASEIKALQQSPAWSGSLDVDQLEAYFSLGYVMAPHTIYRHVRKLEPGHWMRVRDGRLQTVQYWDVERFDDLNISEQEAIERIDAELAARVRERLESEVPLGAFLSGGIDSGLIVSHMATACAHPVVTTTVGFGDVAHNEIQLAALTAERYAATHVTHIIEPTLDEAFDGIICGFDEPFADASTLPTWYVSREARRHVTVALTGDGGDEAFGGYDFRYVPHAMEDRVRQQLPRAVRSAAGRAGAAWPRGQRVPRALRFGTYLENVARSSEAAYFADLCFLPLRDVRALLGKPPVDERDTGVYEAVTAAYRKCPSENVVQRAQYADLKVYLPNDVLVKVDRMSMQHGLEVRSPLLDRRLIELAFRLPQQVKRADVTGKHLLRRVAERRLPEPLLGASKRGFTAPIGAWLAGPLSRQFENEVLGPGAAIGALVDPTVVKKAFIAHREGRRDGSFLLWAVWCLQRWCVRQSAPLPETAAQLVS